VAIRGSITKRHYVYYICLCYGYNICYVLIYCVLCTSDSLHVYIRSIWLQPVLEHTWRSTWWHLSRELREALGGCDWVNWEMNMEALIDQYKQNIKWFRSHNSITRLFWTAAPIIPDAPRGSQSGWMQNDILPRCCDKCFQVLLNVSKVAQQNIQIFLRVWSCLCNAIKSSL